MFQFKFYKLKIICVWVKLNENKSDLQEDYTVVEKQVDHEKMQYNQMEKLYFRKQAGIFALQLKEDQPCPIVALYIILIRHKLKKKI